MSDGTGPAPAAATTPRPQTPRRVDLLSAPLMRRFADAGKWSRGAGAAMVVLGIFLTVFGALSGIANVTFWQMVFIVSSGVTYLVPGALMLVYGRRIGRAVEEEPSINIEMAMTDARRFWVALALCAALLTAIEVPLTITPAVSNAMRHFRTNKSAAALLPVRDALERYAEQHHSYPNVKSYADLVHVLQPAYGQGLPARDPSGGELVYRVDCALGYCPSYTLSANDNKAGLTVTVSNGQFTRAPKEWIGR